VQKQSDQKKELIQTSEDNNEAYLHYPKGDNEAFEQEL